MDPAPIFLAAEEVIEIHADGNKRIGAAAATVFLKMNGVAVVPEEPALSDLVLAVAQSTAHKQEIIAFLRAHAKHE